MDEANNKSKSTDEIAWEALLVGASQSTAKCSITQILSPLLSLDAQFVHFCES